LIFALFCIVARLLHRYFLYIPDPKRVDPHEAGLTGVEEIVFKSAEGKKQIAWYRPAAKGKRTLLYFPAIAATSPPALARSRQSSPTAMASSSSTIAALAGRPAVPPRSVSSGTR
jgi:hypothetical protein